MTENERIRKIRKARKLTLEKFGDKVGVSRAAMSNIENGNRNVTEQMRKAICREFNVDYIYLTTGEGEMFVDDDIGLMETIDRIMAEEDEFHKNLIKFSAERTDEELELLEHLLDEAIKLFKKE